MVRRGDWEPIYDIVEDFIAEKITEYPHYCAQELADMAAEELSEELPHGFSLWHRHLEIVRRRLKIKADPRIIHERSQQRRRDEEDRMREIQDHIAANVPGDMAEISRIPVQRLAASMLRNAWDDADRMLRPRFSEASPSVRAEIKYSAAWLQMPNLTAKWCECLGIDPEMVASMSRRKHGVPRFDEAEKLHLQRAVS